MVPGINVCRYIFREVTLFLSKNLLLNGICLVERGVSSLDREPACEDTDIWGVEGSETATLDVDSL